MSEGVSKLCLIGTGLMGASAAAALKQSTPDAFITVVDLRLGRQDTSRLTDKYRHLQEQGWVDAVSGDLTAVLERCDALLLALPLASYPEYLNAFRPLPNLLITDAGSAKQCVLDFARQAWGDLPPGLIPAHPMAGSAVSGHEHADARLYTGSSVFVSPHANSADWALARAQAFWRQLGAQHIEHIDAGIHDTLLGFGSHLPQMLAYVLARSACTHQGQSGFAPACGAGLRDSTRLAGGHPRVWRDICRYNSEPILKAIENFADELDRVRDMINRADFEALEEFFAQANLAREIIESTRADNSSSKAEALSPLNSTHPIRDQ